MMSEAQRQEIIDYTGSMSVREISKKVGVSVGSVVNVQKSLKNVQDPPATPARACAREKAPTVQKKTERVQKVNCTVVDVAPHIVGKSETLLKIIDHLHVEQQLYEGAIRRGDSDPQAKWEIVQHSKEITAIHRDLAKYYGLDKGIDDMLPKDEDSNARLEAIKKRIDAHPEILQVLFDDE